VWKFAGAARRVGRGAVFRWRAVAVATPEFIFSRRKVLVPIPFHRIASRMRDDFLQFVNIGSEMLHGAFDVFAAATVVRPFSSRSNRGSAGKSFPSKYSHSRRP